MALLSEFRQFLKEYNIAALAIAFIIGVAATTLIQSLVANIIMPFIAPLTSGGNWQTATWHLGPVTIGWGAFLAALINFVIIALVVFLIAKYLLREEKVTKK